MFTAVMVLCSVVNITQCQGMSSSLIYTTKRECDLKQSEAYEYFKKRNMLVMGYRCVNWGEGV